VPSAVDGHPITQRIANRGKELRCYTSFAPIFALIFVGEMFYRHVATVIMTKKMPKKSMTNTSRCTCFQHYM